MVESVFINSGRSCINTSGIWASRHTKEIAEALAARLAKVEALPPDRPQRRPGGLHRAGRGGGDLAVDRRRSQGRRRRGRDRVTPARCAGRQAGARRLPAADRGALRLAGAPPSPRRNTCSPSSRWWSAPRRRWSRPSARRSCAPRSPAKPELQRQLLDAVHIDRLNLGPVPTSKLNWLQPHEGNIVEFLFRARAYQEAGADRNCQLPAASLESPRYQPQAAHDAHPLDHGGRRRDVLRSLLSRQCAGRRAAEARARRAPGAGLHADPHRRAQRQRAPRAVRRHQRLPAAVVAAVPAAAEIPRSGVGRTRRHRRVREPVGVLHRSEAAGRADSRHAGGHVRASWPGSSTS